MERLRFDGRVVVVTGAGRGIGRAYALLLAERGAAVVVNDLGGSMDGVGADTGVAAAVVAEIETAGGQAVPDAHDVGSPEGAAALVETAVDRFGHIDVVVTNAGIIRWAGFPEADADNLERHLAVHVGGTFHTCRAAWGHFVSQGYGRIVNTTSSGLFGLPDNLSYAAAKGAVVGLTRSLATAGTRHGITANLIAPAAMTRMAGAADADPGDGRDRPSGPLAPATVAPMVAFLAHESCPVTGQIYAAGAGRFARVFIASTPGYVHPTPAPTVEDVADHWADINEEAGYCVPADLPEWSAAFLAHLRPDGSAATR